MLTPEEDVDLKDFIGELLAALVEAGSLPLSVAGELVGEYDLEEVR